MSLYIFSVCAISFFSFRSAPPLPVCCTKISHFHCLHFKASTLNQSVSAAAINLTRSHFLSLSPLLQSLLIMHAAKKFKWDRFLKHTSEVWAHTLIFPILLHPGPSLSSSPTNRCPGNCNVLETCTVLREQGNSGEGKSVSCEEWINNI